jgi:hypothetical protein
MWKVSSKFRDAQSGSRFDRNANDAAPVLVDLLVDLSRSVAPATNN